MMDVDKLILALAKAHQGDRFGTMMDVDKLIHGTTKYSNPPSFGTMMDVDKLIHRAKHPFGLLTFWDYDGC